MLRLERKTALLARALLTAPLTALLTLPGLAGAQASPAQSSPAQGPAQEASADSVYRARNFYLVFKLGTTLPVTVQDTAECAGTRLAGPERLLNYSFVSSRSLQELTQDLTAFLREHTFRAAGPLAAEDGVGRRVELTDPAAPGFRYSVTLRERPGGSALCVTLRLPPAPPTEPSNSASTTHIPGSRPLQETS